MRQGVPTRPTVADNRTRNLLILRRPADDFAPVTAEVASSSLVVPAILFNHLQALILTDQGILGDDKRQTRVPHSGFAAKRHLLDQIRFGQQARRQDAIDQLVLCKTLGLRCRLQVFVRDVEVAVPQVVADRELVLSQVVSITPNRFRPVRIF